MFDETGLPPKPAGGKEGLRSLSSRQYKAYCRRLARIATSSGYSNERRREALERLIEAHSILWTYSLANEILTCI